MDDFFQEETSAFGCSRLIRSIRFGAVPTCFCFLKSNFHFDPKFVHRDTKATKTPMQQNKLPQWDQK